MQETRWSQAAAPAGAYQEIPPDSYYQVLLHLPYLG